MYNTTVYKQWSCTLMYVCRPMYVCMSKREHVIDSLLLDHLQDENSCKIYSILSFAFRKFINYDFVVCTYLTHIAAPSAIIDGVTYFITH